MSVSPSTPTKLSEAQVNDEARRKAIDATLASMENAISTAELTYFSNRSIAEVEALQEEVSAVIPAGNIVGLVMSGLVKLRDRTLPPNKAKSDVSALMRGLDLLPRNILSHTVYGTLMVGPAAVLAAYQKLLTLTGKDPDSAFPEGLWQFYLEFAMREDGARHANETIGFQKALLNYGLALSEGDQLAAWVCAAGQIYFQYDDLLHNEWRERIYLHLVNQVVTEANLGHKLSFKRLPQAWAAQRPYHRGQDASQAENFAAYRRRRFDNFLQSRLSLLPEAQKSELLTAYERRAAEELSAYQQQMSLLASLDPDQYRENKQLVPLWQALVGVIYRRRYYLIPAYQADQAGRPILFESQEANARFYALQPDPATGNLHDPQGHLLRVDRRGQIFRVEDGELCGYLRPAAFQAVRRLVAALFEHADRSGDGSLYSLDDQLIAIKRTEQGRARQLLRAEGVQRELAALKCAPILINWDEQDSAKPLGYIRQGKRGIGDHALTIFRTKNSIVFDQSHIFFDGTWGMALAEILTGEAISWAVYFNSLPAPTPTNAPPYHLNLDAVPSLNKFSRSIGKEVCVENDHIKLKALYLLCKLLSKRHPDLKLTVNDLLILYRCTFGRDYHLSPELEDALFEFYSQNTPASQATYELIKTTIAKAQSMNPSIVIPMAATAARPRERLYPTTFRNPFTELWGHYKYTSDLLQSYLAQKSQASWLEFAEARRSLLAQLNYFGQLMRAYKRVGLEGGSTSTAAMKLLAYLPDSLLKLLDEIPKRVDILNEVLKGEEVFSNVGRVVRGSSITRFISAKDDNDNKTLVWAIVTDDEDILHFSLRDFRPHVAELYKMGRADLAELIAKDYLDAFVKGFNQFVKCLLEILNINASHADQGRAE
jgi:hypothetical protein